MNTILREVTRQGFKTLGGKNGALQPLKLHSYHAANGSWDEAYPVARSSKSISAWVFTPLDSVLENYKPRFYPLFEFMCHSIFPGPVGFLGELAICMERDSYWLRFREGPKKAASVRTYSDRSCSSCQKWLTSVSSTLGRAAP